MENSYFKRFLQIIAVTHRIEEELGVHLYCRGYDRKSPWPLSAYYILTAIGYTVFFIHETGTINNWSRTSAYAAALCSSAPLFIVAFAIMQVNSLATLLPNHPSYSPPKSHAKNMPSYNESARIVTPITKAFGFMKHHVENVGQGVPNELTYLSNEINNPSGRLFAAYRRLTAVNNAESHVTPHTHTVDQMYCWIGCREDLTGLKVEVVLDGKATVVESPKSVYIPAGVTHSHRYVEGDGHFIGILITDGRSYNDVTND
jgi:hypothetical protein